MKALRLLGLVSLMICISFAYGDNTYVDIPNEDYYYAITEQKDKTVLVYFYGTWCGPCKPFDSDFVKLKQQYPNTPFYRVDVDQFKPQFFHDIQMYQVPTVYLYVNGSLSDQFYGHTPENVEKLYKFAEAASELPKVEVN